MLFIATLFAVICYTPTGNEHMRSARKIKKQRMSIDIAVSETGP